MQQNWDIEADVVVVGFGAAGVAASVTAHDLGAEVVILEKAPDGQHGGNTRVAGQGYLSTSSAEDAAVLAVGRLFKDDDRGAEIMRGD